MCKIKQEKCKALLRNINIWRGLSEQAYGVPEWIILPRLLQIQGYPVKILWDLRVKNEVEF